MAGSLFNYTPLSMLIERNSTRKVALNTDTPSISAIIGIAIGASLSFFLILALLAMCYARYSYKVNRPPSLDTVSTDVETRGPTGQTNHSPSYDLLSMWSTNSSHSEAAFPPLRKIPAQLYQSSSQLHTEKSKLTDNPQTLDSSVSLSPNASMYSSSLSLANSKALGTISTNLGLLPPIHPALSRRIFPQCHASMPKKFDSITDIGVAISSTHSAQSYVASLRQPKTHGNFVSDQQLASILMSTTQRLKEAQNKCHYRSKREGCSLQSPELATSAPQKISNTSGDAISNSVPSRDSRDTNPSKMIARSMGRETDTSPPHSPISGIDCACLESNDLGDSGTPTSSASSNFRDSQKFEKGVSSTDSPTSIYEDCLTPNLTLPAVNERFHDHHQLQLFVDNDHFTSDYPLSKPYGPRDPPVRIRPQTQTISGSGNASSHESDSLLPTPRKIPGSPKSTNSKDCIMPNTGMGVDMDTLVPKPTEEELCLKQEPPVLDQDHLHSSTVLSSNFPKKLYVSELHKSTTSPPAVIPSTNKVFLSQAIDPSSLTSLYNMHSQYATVSESSLNIQGLIGGPNRTSYLAAHYPNLTFHYFNTNRLSYYNPFTHPLSQSQKKIHSRDDNFSVSPSRTAIISPHNFRSAILTSSDTKFSLGGTIRLQSKPDARTSMTPYLTDTSGTLDAFHYGVYSPPRIKVWDSIMNSVYMLRHPNTEVSTHSQSASEGSADSPVTYNLQSSRLNPSREASSRAKRNYLSIGLSSLDPERHSIRSIFKDSVWGLGMMNIENLKGNSDAMVPGEMLEDCALGIRLPTLNHQKTFQSDQERDSISNVGRSVGQESRWMQGCSSCGDPIDEGKENIPYMRNDPRSMQQNLCFSCNIFSEKVTLPFFSREDDWNEIKPDEEGMEKSKAATLSKSHIKSIASISIKHNTRVSLQTDARTQLNVRPGIATRIRGEEAERGDRREGNTETPGFLATMTKRKTQVCIPSPQPPAVERKRIWMEYLGFCDDSDILKSLRRGRSARLSVGTMYDQYDGFRKGNGSIAARTGLSFSMF